MKPSNGKCAIVADCHIGPRSTTVGSIWEQGLVAERMLFSFYEFMVWCEENGHYTPIVAGDFFDRRLISPDMIGKLSTQFKQYTSRGVRVLVLQGNHDVDLHNGSALDYLPDVYVEKITRPGIHYCTGTDSLFEFLAVPFVYGQSAEESLDQALGLLSKHHRPENVRLLVGHFGLYSDGAAHWEKNDKLSMHATKLSNKLSGTSIRVAAVGHYHKLARYQMPTVDLIQIGSLSPRNWGETGPAFGNVLEVWGLDHFANDVDYRHHISACSGIRYIASPGQLELPYTEGIDTSILARNWYILHEEMKDFPVKSIVVDAPKDINDVIGGAVTIAGYNKERKQYYDGNEIGPHGVSAQRAVELYCRRTSGEFDGPVTGLVSEAIARTRDGARPGLVTKPQIEFPIRWRR